jgi:hypothetical protein
MLKIVCAAVIASIAAACIIAFPGLSPQIEADSSVPGTKSDRADARLFGVDCTQKAWPYFERACLRQTQSPTAQPRDVRVVGDADARAGR